VEDVIGISSRGPKATAPAQQITPSRSHRAPAAAAISGWAAARIAGISSSTLYRWQLLANQEEEGGTHRELFEALETAAAVVVRGDQRRPPPGQRHALKALPVSSPVSGFEAFLGSAEAI
jgi:hypothetical protein